MKETIPTRKDINVHDSLDERNACEHFLGKSLDDAEKLFRENSLHYQEDLMWMGPVAFRFYVEAAICYIQSEAGAGDSDMVSCFVRILKHRLTYETEELVPVAEKLASICGYILEHWEKFNVPAGIHGDLRDDYRAIQQSFLLMTSMTKMNDDSDWQPRPITYVPRKFLPEPTGSGCVLRLTLRDGRTVKGVGVDMKGCIYGVLVKETVDSRLNPIDFRAEDIVAAKQISLKIPKGYKVV